MERTQDRTDGLVRVLSLALPEPQWRALLDIEPEPIAWLHGQIRDRLHEQEPVSEPDAVRLSGPPPPAG